MFTEFNWNEAIGSSPIFIVIVGCSVVMLGIAIERAYYFKKRKGNPDATLATVLGKLSVGDVKDALWACDISAHPLGNVASQIFKNGKQEREPVEEKIQVALSEQKLLLERNLGVLGTLATVAPLIGLLGTVWGIMRAFNDMAITGSAAPSVVAAGVAEALVTTAAGLIVAVPALMLYNHFTRRMNVMLTVAENYARSIRSAFIEALAHDARPPDDVDRNVDGQLLKSSDDRCKVETREPSPVR
jgi:biopolymer transport protein ExbB